MRIGSLAVSAPGMKAMDNLEDYNKATRPRLDLVTPITRYEEHAAHDAHATNTNSATSGASPHTPSWHHRPGSAPGTLCDSTRRRPNEAEGNTDYI